MKKTYIIKCKMNGGGFRSFAQPLKENGKIKFFNSKEAAEKEADNLNKTMNNGVGMFTYTYWVEEV